MLFVSSEATPGEGSVFTLVSISESRCFSFQGRVSFFQSSSLALFQSRNRDAFHFKLNGAIRYDHPFLLFQSRNRDAFHFKRDSVPGDDKVVFVSISESRCFSFQAYPDPRRYGVTRPVSISESRCFSFQVQVQLPRMTMLTTSCFNLGIEMLFISRINVNPFQFFLVIVSISESRCFSFQVPRYSQMLEMQIPLALLFQSRNRDAFRFKVNRLA